MPWFSCPPFTSAQLNAPLANHAVTYGSKLSLCTPSNRMPDNRRSLSIVASCRSHDRFIALISTLINWALRRGGLPIGASRAVAELAMAPLEANRGNLKKIKYKWFCNLRCAHFFPASFVVNVPRQLSLLWPSPPGWNFDPEIADMSPRHR